MVNQNSQSASNATSLGPGDAVAGSSALEETSVDDLALSLDMIEISVPVVGDQVACPVCQKREIDLFFLSLSDLGRHLEQHHVTARIQWRCKDCGKGFPKLHGARCHLPHCRGTSQGPSGSYRCETCPMSFGTLRGLSTHERHAHPAVRNVKRRGTDPPEKKWTAEELAQLRDLWEIYKDHKFPNKMISEILTSKTIEQIRYQRKKLRLIGEEANSQEPTQVTEGGCDPVDPGNACFEEPGVSGLEYEQWRLQLESAIMTQVEVPPVLRDLPDAEEVRRLYVDLWGQTGPVEAPVPGSRASELSLCEVFPPIAVEDVAEKLSKIRMKAAAGPDGFQKEHLLIPGLPTILAILYNILLYCSYFPPIWKENRTTLIPKPNKSSSLIENWRPITIGPILGRIFSSIIDGRIRRGIVLNPRQKGFTAESGSFDTVPHSAIVPCLRRKGVPIPITDLVSNMYNEGKTTIKSNNSTGVEITILRGVKQGDPLSPLLFNVCLEPLLDLIEQQTSGINVSETRKIPVLAFADDVVLLGADIGEAHAKWMCLTSI
ncbi:uncharacterized protein LOC143303384 [Bombus vancouverensis nearcticus]|uniref:uncharacterized protein LOC143303384 n=1 Tax=Bombus vancouverensis nearcticus TaxID=2705178 RepID=UPI00402BF16A